MKLFALLCTGNNYLLSVNLPKLFEQQQEEEEEKEMKICKRKGQGKDDDDDDRAAIKRENQGVLRVKEWTEHRKVKRHHEVSMDAAASTNMQLVRKEEKMARGRWQERLGL